MKKLVLLFLLLFCFQQVFSQVIELPLQDTKSLLVDYDEIWNQLKLEIENLNFQIQQAQKSLIVSQEELQRLKETLVQQQTQYNVLESSYRHLNESLKTSESSLRKTSGWLIGSVAVNIAFIVAGCIIIF